MRTTKFARESSEPAVLRRLYDRRPSVPLPGASNGAGACLSTWLAGNHLGRRRCEKCAASPPKKLLAPFSRAHRPWPSGSCGPRPRSGSRASRTRRRRRPSCRIVMRPLRETWSYARSGGRGDPPLSASRGAPPAARGPQSPGIARAPGLEARGARDRRRRLRSACPPGSLAVGSRPHRRGGRSARSGDRLRSHWSICRSGGDHRGSREGVDGRGHRLAADRQAVRPVAAYRPLTRDRVEPGRRRGDAGRASGWTGPHRCDAYAR